MTCTKRWKSTGWAFRQLFLIQWNPVNTVTNGTKKIGRTNEGFLTRQCIAVLPGSQKKSARNKEVTELPRWLAGRQSFTVHVCLSFQVWNNVFFNEPEELQALLNFNTQLIRESLSLSSYNNNPAWQVVLFYFHSVISLLHFRSIAWIAIFEVNRMDPNKG